MSHRLRVFILVLAIPLIGFGVAEGIQRSFNSDLRVLMHMEYPDVPEERIALLTFDLLCEGVPLGVDEACDFNSYLNLLSRAAVGAGVVGLSLLGLIRLIGGFARNNRNLLVILFRPGLYVTAVVLIGLILVHAAVAMAAIYIGEAFLIGRVHGRIIVLIGFGALAGIYAMARASFALVGKVETSVVGKTLTREEAPGLWSEIDRAADQLNALRPENVVVGLSPTFFVTEAHVNCLDGRLSGRTLYCSLPLSRILTREELISVIGHELAHFKGMDTKFSKRFFPIYQGTATAIAALQQAGGRDFRSVALWPALATFNLLSGVLRISRKPPKQGA